MTTAAVNYAKVLYGMPVSITTVQETENLFQENPELTPISYTHLTLPTIA